MHPVANPHAARSNRIPSVIEALKFCVQNVFARNAGCEYPTPRARAEALLPYRFGSSEHSLK